MKIICAECDITRQRLARAGQRRDDTMPQPEYDPMTCIHRDHGLCPSCRSDYEEDPLAWLEYGSHPVGIAAWEALQAEMLADWQADRDAERYYEETKGVLGSVPADVADDIPF